MTEFCGTEGVSPKIRVGSFYGLRRLYYVEFPTLWVTMEENCHDMRGVSVVDSHDLYVDTPLGQLHIHTSKEDDEVSGAAIALLRHDGRREPVAMISYKSGFNPSDSGRIATHVYSPLSRAPLVLDHDTGRVLSDNDDDILVSTMYEITLSNPAWRKLRFWDGIRSVVYFLRKAARQLPEKPPYSMADVKEHIADFYRGLYECEDVSRTFGDRDYMAGTMFAIRSLPETVNTLRNREIRMTLPENVLIQYLNLDESWTQKFTAP